MNYPCDPKWYCQGQWVTFIQNWISYLFAVWDEFVRSQCNRRGFQGLPLKSCPLSCLWKKPVVEKWRLSDQGSNNRLALGVSWPSLNHLICRYFLSLTNQACPLDDLNASLLPYHYSYNFMILSFIFPVKYFHSTEWKPLVKQCLE